MIRGKSFAKTYGVLIEDGPLAGVTARAVVVARRERQGGLHRARPRDRAGAELRRRPRRREVAAPRPGALDAQARVRWGLLQVARGRALRSVATDRALRRSALLPTALTFLGSAALAALVALAKRGALLRRSPSRSFVAISSMPPTLLWPLWTRLGKEARRARGRARPARRSGPARATPRLLVREIGEGAAPGRGRGHRARPGLLRGGARSPASATGSPCRSARPGPGTGWCSTRSRSRSSSSPGGSGRASPPGSSGGSGRWRARSRLAAPPRPGGPVRGLARPPLAPPGGVHGTSPLGVGRLRPGVGGRAGRPGAGRLLPGGGHHRRHRTGGARRTHTGRTPIANWRRGRILSRLVLVPSGKGKPMATVRRSILAASSPPSPSSPPPRPPTPPTPTSP